jgi:hypothetical protein
MLISPLCLVADGAGPFNPPANGVNVGQNHTISIKLVDATGVDKWYLQVIGTDELSTAPSLTNVNPSTNQVTTPNATVTFTYPNAQGRALLFMSTVTGPGGPLISTFAIYTLTSFGKRVASTGEQREGNTSFGWATLLNPILRTGAAALFYDDSLNTPHLGFNTVQGVIDFLKEQGASGVTIANNMAELALLPGVEGELVFVKTLKTFFIYTSSSTLAADGITVQTTQSGGATRWLRTSFSHPSWRLEHDDWYIDSIAGNDENNGATALTALRTGAELSRRYGHGNLVRSTSVDLSIRYHIKNDLLAPDYFELDVTADVDTYFRILGENTATLRTGTLANSGGVIVENPNTNQPWVIKDTGVVTWETDARIRFTNGPANNGTCWPAKDLGSGSLRVSPPCTWDEPDFFNTANAVTPANGNTYAVERLTKINLGEIRVRRTTSAFGFALIVNVANLDIQNPGPGFAISDHADGHNLSISYYGCRVRQPLYLRSEYYINSFLSDGVLGTTFFNNIGFSGCLFKYINAQNPFFLVSNWRGSFGNVTTYLQGVPLLFVGSNAINAGSVAVFDVPISFANPGGHGINVGFAKDVFLEQAASLGVVGSIWGSGNAGAGIRMSAGSSLSIHRNSITTITGTGGDFILADAATARAWDEAVGAPTGVITCTWANLALAIASGGFGGSAHNFQQRASVVLGSVT